MQAQRAGKQAVAKRDLRDVVPVYADRSGQTGDAVAPNPDVLAGIAHDSRFAGCAARCVDAHNIAHGHGEQAVRVIVAHVRLCRIGYVLYVGQRLDLLRRHARFAEDAVVIRHDSVTVIDDMPEPLELQSFQLSAGHRLQLFLKKQSTSLFRPYVTK